MRKADVVVIGAGVNGAATAYHLARRGRPQAESLVRDFLETPRSNSGRQFDTELLFFALQPALDLVSI